MSKKVESPFAKKDLQGPNFLDKICGREPKDNALVEVINRLADGIETLDIEEILKISEKYKVDFYRKFRPSLKELYKNFFHHCLSDCDLSDNEIEQLSYLKKLFNLNDKEIIEIHDNVSRSVYKESVIGLISDGKLDDCELDFLIKLQNVLQVPEGIANKIYLDCATALYDLRFKDAISDQRLSPEECEELQLIEKSLGLKIDLPNKTKEILEKYRMFWNIENGNIPEVLSPVNLFKNEKCYCTAPSQWLEMKIVSKKINQSGLSFNIKLAKGLYWRANEKSFKHVSKMEIHEKDSGQIIITDRRLIFNGKRNTLTIKLNRILDFITFMDGIEIARENGEKIYFQFEFDSEIFSMILGKAIKDLAE